MTMDPFMLIALSFAALAAGGAVRSRPSKPSKPSDSDLQEVLETTRRHTGMLMARCDRIQMENERARAGNERLAAVNAQLSVNNARLAAENEAIFARLMTRLPVRPAASDYPDW